MAKRKIFDELMEGVAAMRAQREGKTTLPQLPLEKAPKTKENGSL